MQPGPGGHLGAFIAWDAARGKKLWEIREPYPVWSGALATAGGLVFYGTLDGWLKAADAKSGAVLWKFKVGSGVVGNPITFTGPDRRQYVAVYGLRYHVAQSSRLNLPAYSGPLELTHAQAAA